MRTRSFVVLTLLLPAIMTGVMVLPAKLATIGNKVQHLVVVTSTRSSARPSARVYCPPLQSPTARMTRPTPNQLRQDADEQYIIDVDSNPTEAERTVLRDKIIAELSTATYG